MQHTHHAYKHTLTYTLTKRTNNLWWEQQQQHRHRRHHHRTATTAQEPTRTPLDLLFPQDAVLAQAIEKQIRIIFLLTNSLKRNCRPLAASDRKLNYKTCKDLYDFLASSTGGTVRCPPPLVYVQQHKKTTQTPPPRVRDRQRRLRRFTT